MMKVAEGAVSSTVEILKTLKEKAVNAANDSNTDSDRQTIQKELNQSIDQINDNANVTINGKYLVDGYKNTIGNATYTALSNQSLKTDTTAATKLTDLAARSGDSLEIHDTDKVTVSYVKSGKTYSTTYQVKDTTLQDIFNKAEEVNKAEIGATYDAVKDALFASADNKSVGAAMVADKQMTQSDYDNIAATKQAAIDAADAAKTTATTGLDARITTLTTAAVYTGAKKAVDSDYTRAKELFNKAKKYAATKYDAFIFYYLARIEENQRDYAAAYNFYSKSIDSFHSLECTLNEKYKAAIYMRYAHLCLSIGYIWNAVAYYYSAYDLSENIENKLDILSDYLMSLTASNATSLEILEATQKYNKAMQSLKILPFKHVNKEEKKKKCIAYISPDYRYHVMYSFYYNLFAKYDKNNFYVICLSLNKKKDDAYTEKIKSLVDEYIDIGDLSREDMAEKIKSMNVDILVDLAGHSANSGLSLFAYRVAPVQISGLGWMETTGFSAVDYLITDEYLDPTGNTYITERPLYLKSQFCYKCHRDVVASSGAPCIKNGYITFATFNRISKFTSEILELWRRIMYLVPNSFLLLKCDILSSKSNMQMVRKRLANAGLDNKRIILESPSLDYLERYLDVDIALDTYPYTGGGTTFDALYMGFPVVSLYGERRSSRFGLSILTNAGVGELAVPTPKEYVERAVALASDWDLLDVLHKNLRTMLENSPAMDAEGYVREIEGKYKEILSAVHNHDVFD